MTVSEAGELKRENASLKQRLTKLSEASLLVNNSLDFSSCRLVTDSSSLDEGLGYFRFDDRGLRERWQAGQPYVAPIAIPPPLRWRRW